MNARDKAILDDLTRFRCMSRDDIASIHFAKVKNSVTQANTVLKRLRRDGHITCSTERRMYLYFPIPGIKQDSSKIPHYLSIVDFYKQLIAIEPAHTFAVEPRVGDKGTIEPDIFCIWQRTPFFVEIQRSHYRKKVMDAKIKRYEEYYHSDAWKQEPWQPADKKVFPRLWIVSDAEYSLGDELLFKVIQTRGVMELMQRRA